MITDSHFHAFASKLHILQKPDNTVNWEFAYRRWDKPDNVQFMKPWEKWVASVDAGLKELLNVLNSDALSLTGNYV